MRGGEDGSRESRVGGEGEDGSRESRVGVGGDGKEGEECTAYLKTTPTVTCPLKRGLARTSYVSLSFSSSARGL